MAGGFNPGDENLDWGYGCNRGLGKRRFVRMDTDEDGREVAVYELQDDDGFGSLEEDLRRFFNGG